ncbi:SAF domain-containing protein [Spongiactinospora rosea]|nr:SAF domain-containing protein [Spongiactinospora rosea]
MVKSALNPMKPKPLPFITRPGAGRVLLGGLVVMGCAFASTTFTMRAEVTASTLAVQSDLPVGHTLSRHDLSTVNVTVGPGVRFVQADRVQEVVGRRLRVPMVAGALLTEGNLGNPTYPHPGQALIGIAVKPGQYPPDIGPGDHVAVSTVSDATDSQRTAPVSVTAVVTKIDRPTEPQNPAVVTLLLSHAQARLVAAPAAQGLTTLMQVAP